MKASELRMMIRKIVAEEIRQLTPVIVEEFLTEKYLSTLVEKRIKKGGGLREVLANDADPDIEDRIPEPPENDHDGVYQGKQRPVDEMRERSTGVASRLLAQDNPWASIYEGVKPIRGDVSAAAMVESESVPTTSMAPVMGESERMFGEGGVPIDKLPGFANRMSSILKATERRAMDKAPMQTSASAEERRLAELRQKLDEQVVSTPKVK